MTIPLYYVGWHINEQAFTFLMFWTASVAKLGSPGPFERNKASNSSLQMSWFQGTSFTSAPRYKSNRQNREIGKIYVQQIFCPMQIWFFVLFFTLMRFLIILCLMPQSNANILCGFPLPNILTSCENQRKKFNHTHYSSRMSRMCFKNTN